MFDNLTSFFTGTIKLIILFNLRTFRRLKSFYILMDFFLK